MNLRQTYGKNFNYSTETEWVKDRVSSPSKYSLKKYNSLVCKFTLSFKTSTHDDSVLELFYKDLYQLYNLKSTLEAEGLDNYVIDHNRTEITNSNSLLH